MNRIAYFLVLLGMMLMPFVASAATEAELKERFKQRHPQMTQLKLEGKLGETTQGFLEAVKPQFASEPAVKGTIDAENSDRRELYELLAKQTSTTPDAVATRNAARNFQKAKKGEWLKHADGVWRQK